MYHQVNETNVTIVRIIVIEQNLCGYSFLLTLKDIQPLLASLAMNPATFVALLQSIDALRSGSAGMIMDQFIHTDRIKLAMMYAAQTPERRPYTGEDAWQITGEATLHAAMYSEQNEKIVIYLAEKNIGSTLPYVYSHLTGELHFFDGLAFLKESVTYDLRVNWHFSFI